MPLEYPITREYTVPHLTTYLSIVSVFVIAALTVLNGYDTVTVLRPDPNVTESYWWSVGPLSGRSAGGCDPVSLSGGVNFITNSSFFSYELRGVFGANEQNIAGASSYTANPLSSCTVDGVMVAIDIGRQTYTFDIPILCASPDLPFSLSLISRLSLNQHNPYYDDIMAYYIRNKQTREGLNAAPRLIQRNASSPANIIGLLDAVSTDFAGAFWYLRNVSTDVTPTLISTGGLFACPGGQINATCKPEEMKMTIPGSAVTYPNGSDTISNGIGTLLAPIERSFLNLFTVLRDAYHIDLGNIRPDNTLLSKDAFSAHIQPDPTLAAAIHNIADFGSLCGWGIGCVQNSTWVDQLLVSNPNLSVTVPSILLSGNSPAVVRVDYLCPEFRIKSPGSLVTSVFIGTWTMYAALFGAFGFVGPMLEKWYSRRRATKVGETEDAGREHPDTWSLIVQPEGGSWDESSSTKR
ncbi:hypothetical protein FRC10_009836 [Ceratobasidium sp. 414]|nr:hypothetical protein FRC10_009836 [Ceratobasidium sp. 414]